VRAQAVVERRALVAEELGVFGGDGGGVEPVGDGPQVGERGGGAPPQDAERRVPLLAGREAPQQEHLREHRRLGVGPAQRLAHPRAPRLDSLVRRRVQVAAAAGGRGIRHRHPPALDQLPQRALQAAEARAVEERRPRGELLVQVVERHRGDHQQTQDHELHVAPPFRLCQYIP
jgi:hypothetical protein